MIKKESLFEDMKDVKVSIVVPVHNAEDYIEQCLDSILNQTMQAIELICVDDMSGDSSLQILEKYKKKDSRVSVISLSSSGPGAADARNAGLDIAKGKYIAFLDADDYFDCKLIEKTYIAAERKNADIVMFDARSFDSRTGNFNDVGTYLSSELLPDKEVFSVDDFQEDVFQSTIGAAWNNLYRRLFVVESGIRFKPHYHTDDTFFAYSALISAERITAVKEKLLFYRINNDNSQTGKRTLNPLSAPEAWIELQDSLIEKGQYEKIRRSFQNKALHYCRWYLENINDSEGFAILYNDLHDSSIKKLGFSDDNENEFRDKSLFKWCQEVVGKSKMQFLFDRLQLTERKMYSFQPEFEFPFEKVNKEDRVILYGAGSVGRRFFVQNLKGGFCNIIAWVDKHALEMGGLMIEPSRIAEFVFDRIIIATIDIEVRESIINDLVLLGIDSSKIV